MLARITRKRRSNALFLSSSAHFYNYNYNYSYSRTALSGHLRPSSEGRAIRRSGGTVVTRSCFPVYHQGNFFPSRLFASVHRHALQQINYSMATLIPRRVHSTQAKGKGVETSRHDHEHHDHEHDHDHGHEDGHSHSHSRSILGSLVHTHGPEDSHAKDAEQIVEALKGGGR